MATPTRSQAVSTPKNPMNTTPNRPTASPRPNMAAFATRQFAGKSPAVKTPASMPGHTHRISVSSHPTSTPLAATVMADDILNFNSPSNAAIMASMTQTGLTPLPSGQDGLGLGTALDSMTGQAMSVAKDPLVERQARAREVIAILKEKAGKHSATRDYIENLVKAAGLSTIWDDDILQVAGENILDLEIHFGPDGSDEVVKTFLKLGSDEVVPDATAVLHQNLTKTEKDDPNGMNMTKFMENLDYLGNLDRIGASDNPLEAIGDLYTTFRRIWDEEKSRMKWRHETHHACQSNVGDPYKNSGGRLGLQTKYWDRGYEYYKPAAADALPQSSTAWVAEFSCQHGQPSMAASRAWLADTPLAVSLTTENLFRDTQLDKPSWQEDTSEDKTKGQTHDDPMLTDGDKSHAEKTQEMQFTCALAPGVLLPVHLINAANAGFHIIKTEQQHVHPVLEAYRLPLDLERWDVPTVTFDDDGSYHQKNHTFTIYVSGSAYLSRVTQLQFYHPRQYADLVPILRQYCVLETLLSSLKPSDKKDFGHGEETTSPPPIALPVRVRDRTQTTKRSNKRAEEKLTQFLESTSTYEKQSLPIEIHIDLVSDSTTAKLEISFPMPRPSKTASKDNTRRFVAISIAIRQNGVIDVTDMQGVETKSKDEISVIKKKLAKVLRMSENIGMSIEWLRAQVGRIE